MMKQKDNKLMRYRDNSNQIKGFTLLELMIVVAIIGILAAISFPSYLDSIQKARRADGYESLLACASAQARYFTRSTPSTYMNPATAQNENLCGWDGADHVSQDGFYELEITNPSSCSRTIGTGTAYWCFSITATPVGAQADDVNCNEFTIDERGNKGAVNSSNVDNTDVCWRN